MENGVENGGGSVALKGKTARCHFVEYDGKGKKIAAGIERLAERLFGGHVGDGSDRTAGAGEKLGSQGFACRAGGAGADGSIGFEFSEAEVQNFGVAARGDENIGGLDIAMQDALGVGGVERVSDVDADVQQAVEFQRRTVDQVFERGAFHELHNQECAAIFFADIVDSADIGVIQRGSSFGFAAESLQRCGIPGERIGKKFDGDEAFEAGVLRFVDNAHSSTA